MSRHRLIHATPQRCFMSPAGSGPPEHRRTWDTSSCLAGIVWFAVTVSLPGIAWCQNDLTDIPTPDPVAELAAMEIHPDAAGNLFAADPDICKPIQMNFDSTGGLWIASSEVYPQIRPGEIANDKIIVLRDTDGDGVSDSRTVFADGLLIPTGVLPDGPNAAYVAESTRLLYLKDNDGDGRADEKRIVMSGFGTEDTHHLVHTLRFGPDGCVYFNQSIYIHSHIDTPYGSRHLDGGGIWRYRPTTGQLEVFCKGFINPWGHTFTTGGESFVTDGACFDGINYTFPDAVFITSPGATRWLSGLNPGSPKHCGLEILSGTHIPPDWSGMMVTSDFRSHRVCRFSVKPSGSSYLSRQQPEIIKTPHVAFRPIDARMGPDGALYVADWYNPIIQHGEVDFRDDRRDREHGRIWRVSFPGRELDPWPEFASQSVDGLLGLLDDDSLAVRQFSRQELWRRAAQDEAGTLDQVRRWCQRDDKRRTLELLWMNEVVSQPNAHDLITATTILDNLEPEFRRTSLRSVWRSRLRLPVDAPERNQIETFVLLQTKNEDAAVRLEAVVSAGQLTTTEAFEAVLAASRLEIDDNLDFALWQSIRAIDADYKNGSMVAAMDWDDRTDQLAYAVSAIATPEAAEVAAERIERGDADLKLIAAVAAAGSAEQLGRIAKALLVDKRLRNDANLTPLLERTARDGTIPAGVGQVLAGIVQSPGGISPLVANMAATWKVGELESTLVQAVPLISVAQTRDALVMALGNFDSRESETMIDKLAAGDSTADRAVATRAMAIRRPERAVESAVAMLGNPPDAPAATNLIVELLGRKGMAGKIAAAISKQSLDADVARGLLRRVRSSGGDEALATAIRAAGKLDNVAWKYTPELKDEILGLAKSTGSAKRGEAVYRRESLQCIACHAIGTAGGLVGPNLISIGGSAQADYILESLLDPSAKLKEGYTTTSILTDEGQLINGIVIGQDDQSMRLRLADGKETQVLIDAIEQQKPGKSLMPEGLLDAVTGEELADLVAFLSAMGRTPEYTVSTEPIVRSMETLIYTPQANRRLNRTSTDMAASDDPAMTWRPITSMVSGVIPIDELPAFKQHRQTPPTSFVRFTVEAPADGPAQIGLPNEGIEAWVDGKPTPVWNLQSLDLDPGPHVIVLAIDRTRQTAGITVIVK